MEEKYLQKVLSGDTDAFRYFVDKYKDLSFSVAIKIVSQEQVAEEVVQDAFLKAFKNLKQFQGNSKFSTWLYKIVVNESLKKAGRKQLQTSDIDQITFKGADEAIVSDSFNTLKDQERKKYIHLALDQLSENERLILQLFYLNECTIEEIRKITDLSISNIKVILHRARKNMYYCLGRLLKDEIQSIL